MGRQKVGIEGTRFGRLVVQRDSGQRRSDGQVYWNCRCDCGKEHLVTGGDLRHGFSTSCGCRGIKRERITTHHTGPVISRQEAIDRRLKRYFTGKPCLRGHIAERFTQAGTPYGNVCCECNRLRQLVANKSEQAAERQRMSVKRRRDWKRGGGGSLSPNIRDVLYAKQNGKCVYCSVSLDTVEIHIDHRMPLVLGGTNTDDNVQLLCAFCNNSKNATHPRRIRVAHRVRARGVSMRVALHTACATLLSVPGVLSRQGVAAQAL